MRRKRSLFNNIISTAIMAIAIIALIVVYNKYNYNDFVKSVHETNKTQFTRDSEVKYSKMDSYKLESIDYNDAIFFETVPVVPNTPYKVTCKIKVENVENENNTRTGGAHISITNSTERSITINGTHDWQEVTFYFNSRNRDKVNIGFRLGGYEERSKGTAWFSDFKIERGVASTDNRWKMGLFIFPKIDVDVEVNGKTEHVNLEMTGNDIQDLTNNIARLKTSIAAMSRQKITVDYDTFIINDPIKTLSYDKDNGYYVSPEDIYEYINEYVQKNEYDHIYVGIRMADEKLREHCINK